MFSLLKMNIIDKVWGVETGQLGGGRGGEKGGGGG